MCDRWKCRRLCLTRLAEISEEFVRYIRCSIPKRAISNFQRGPCRWTSKSDHRWRTCVVTRLNKNQVIEILRLVCCENLSRDLRTGVMWVDLAFWWQHEQESSWCCGVAADDCDDADNILTIKCRNCIRNCIAPQREAANATPVVLHVNYDGHTKVHGGQPIRCCLIVLYHSYVTLRCDLTFDPVTLTCEPFTFDMCSFCVLYRLWRDQTLYQNNMSEIKQSAAKLLRF